MRKGGQEKGRERERLLSFCAREGNSVCRKRAHCGRINKAKKEGTAQREDYRSFAGEGGRDGCSLMRAFTLSAIRGDGARQSFDGMLVW